MLDIVDLGRGGRDDAEVVASALHRPQQVRLAVDGLQRAVGEDDIHGHDLVGDEAVVALKPAVTTSQGRSHVAHTFASAGDYSVSIYTVLMIGCILTSLFARSPQFVSDSLGLGSTPDLGRLSIFGDLHAAQLVDRDLDAGIHFAQSGDRAMAAVVGEEGNVVLVGVFDLRARLSESWPVHQSWTVAYRCDHVLFIRGDDDDIGLRLIQCGPPLRQVVELLRAGQVDLRARGQLALQHVRHLVRRGGRHCAHGEADRSGRHG